MLSGMKALPCPYEKAILSSQYECQYSRRGQCGERVYIECEDSAGFQLCLEYLKKVRLSARFALKIDKPLEQLPFGKQSKLLYGSLAALQELTRKDRPTADNDNIYMLVKDSMDIYGCMEKFPFHSVVRIVSSYATRKRHRG